MGLGGGGGAAGSVDGIESTPNALVGDSGSPYSIHVVLGSESRWSIRDAPIERISPMVAVAGNAYLSSGKRSGSWLALVTVGIADKSALPDVTDVPPMLRRRGGAARCRHIH